MSRIIIAQHNKPYSTSPVTAGNGVPGVCWKSLESFQIFGSACTCCSWKCRVSSTLDKMFACRWHHQQSTFVRILRRIISPTPFSIGCSFETILLSITALMFTTRWRAVLVPPILNCPAAAVPSKIWPNRERNLQGDGEDSVEEGGGLGYEPPWARDHACGESNHIFRYTFQHCGYRWN